MNIGTVLVDIYISFFRNQKTFSVKKNILCSQKSMYSTGTDIWNSYKLLFVERKIIPLY